MRFPISDVIASECSLIDPSLSSDIKYILYNDFEVTCYVFVPLEGLSLLGAYEDSEEEDASEASSSAARAKLNRSADIDSTLASFMAVSNILLFS